MRSFTNDARSVAAPTLDTWLNVVDSVLVMFATIDAEMVSMNAFEASAVRTLLCCGASRATEEVVGVLVLVALLIGLNIFVVVERDVLVEWMVGWVVGVGVGVAVAMGLFGIVGNTFVGRPKKVTMGFIC